MRPLQPLRVHAQAERRNEQRSHRQPVRGSAHQRERGVTAARLVRSVASGWPDTCCQHTSVGAGRRGARLGTLSRT